MQKTSLLIALVSGAVCAVLLLRHKSRFESQVSGGEPSSVLVVTRDLAVGDKVQEADLQIRQLPAAYLDRRHIRAADVARIVGIRLTTAVRASESLLWTDLAISGDDHRSLSGLVRAGMRAATIRLEGGTMGGLLRPGDRIDLLIRSMRGGEAVVLPLLQNIMVLAVGAQIDGADVVEFVRGGETVTVSVSVAQSQTLALAANEGTLIATLRNPEDILIQEESLVTTSRDLRLSQDSVAPTSNTEWKHRSAPTRNREIENVR